MPKFFVIHYHSAKLFNEQNVSKKTCRHLCIGDTSSVFTWYRINTKIAVLPSPKVRDQSISLGSTSTTTSYFSSLSLKFIKFFVLCLIFSCGHLVNIQTNKHTVTYFFSCCKLVQCKSIVCIEASAVLVHAYHKSKRPEPL